LSRKENKETANAIRLSVASGGSPADHSYSLADHRPRVNGITLLGYGAAALSTASFAPQAWKIIRSRKTHDISLGMYILTVAAFASWLAFGILRREWPLVLSNAICMGLSGFILTMKCLPARSKQKVARRLS
jgi:MtN3 and saliva related transmembrane protein